MVVHDGKTDIDIMTNDSYNFNHFVALPSSRTTFDICHTFDLSVFENLQSLSLTYNTELKIYLHGKNQFYLTWANEINIIASSVPDNVRVDSFDVASLFDRSIFVSLEKTYRVGYKLDDKEDEYDACIEKASKGLVNESVINFLTSYDLKMEADLSEDDLQAVYNLVNYPTKICKFPKYFLEASYNAENAYGVTKMKTNVYDVTSELMLEKVEVKNKPKIHLTFSQTTKLIEVNRIFLLNLISFAIVKNIFSNTTLTPWNPLWLSWEAGLEF